MLVSWPIWSPIRSKHDDEFGKLIQAPIYLMVGCQSRLLFVVVFKFGGRRRRRLSTILMTPL